MIDTLDIGERALARRTLNVAISLWGRQVTGLPIDFQFRPDEEWRSYADEPRNPLATRSKRGWH